jgi:hypothetical protein
LKFYSENFEEGELPADDKVVQTLLREQSREHERWSIFLGRGLIEKNPNWKDAFKTVIAHDRRTRLFLDLILSEESRLAEVAGATISSIEEFDGSSRRILGGNAGLLLRQEQS